MLLGLAMQRQLHGTGKGDGQWSLHQSPEVQVVGVNAVDHQPQFVTRLNIFASLQGFGRLKAMLRNIVPMNCSVG